MKLRSTNVVVASILALTLSPLAHAGVITVLGIEIGTGIDPAGPWEYSTVPSLTGVDFTKVTLADFATVALSDYDVLYIGELFRDGQVTEPAQPVLDALNARAGDIDDFINAGGGVLALPQPIGDGRWQWVPAAIRPDVSTDFISDDTVRIIDPAHPVMTGLTDAGLSGWNAASHGDFRSTGGLDLLVDNGDGRPITLAGAYGLGRVVLTDQDADFHNARGEHSPDQVRFVQNSLCWLSGDTTCTESPVPLPGTAWLMLGGLGLLWRRSRSRTR